MIGDWWVLSRTCSCGHKRHTHLHYRENPQRTEECGLCPCERFQWRIFKWVYL